MASSPSSIRCSAIIASVALALVDPLRQHLEQGLERMRLGAHRDDRAGEALGFLAAGAAEHQPGEASSASGPAAIATHCAIAGDDSGCAGQRRGRPTRRYRRSTARRGRSARVPSTCAAAGAVAPRSGSRSIDAGRSAARPGSSGRSTARAAPRRRMTESGSARCGVGFMAEAVYHLCSRKKAIREGLRPRRGGREGGGMALGALIGAYQEDDSGGLARAAAARRPDPDRISGALRRRGRRGADRRAGRARPAGAATRRSSGCARDGIAVFPVSDGNEAASRFEAGSLILLIGDGVAPTGRSARAARRRRRAGDRDRSRRRGARRHSSGSTRTSRWAGVALVDGRTARRDRGDARRLGPAVDPAAPRAPGRRAASAGRRRPGEPLLVDSAEQLRDFERALIAALARCADATGSSRYVLPMVEEFATERLMETAVRPAMADLGRAGADAGGGASPSRAAGCGRRWCC